MIVPWCIDITPFQGFDLSLLLFDGLHPSLLSFAPSGLYVIHSLYVIPDLFVELLRNLQRFRTYVIPTAPRYTPSAKSSFSTPPNLQVFAYKWLRVA